MSTTSDPLILVLSEDLFIAPHLEDVVRRLGYRIELVGRQEQLGAHGDTQARPVPLTEPLDGADAHFVRRLTELRPALILVDTTCQALPWARWIQVMKTSAATRRLPVIAFGPHVEASALQTAHEAGADLVVPRGRLLKSLPDLIHEWSRVTDPRQVRAACQGELSELARRGIQLHNQGEYFEAHEELEHAWMAAQGYEGYLYRSLLQVSVAYLHVKRGNFRGATKMLLRLRQWLDPLPRRCRGIDISALKANVDELRRALEDHGPEGLAELDPDLLRPFPVTPGANGSAS